jgi:hypothetical protein
MTYALIRSFITSTCVGSLIQSTICEMLHIMSIAAVKHHILASLCVNRLMMAELYDHTRMSTERHKY